MHCSWGWIKQRPHFIAEGLSESCDLTVVTKWEFTKQVVNNGKNVNIKRLFRMPFERFHLVFLINSIIYKIQLHILGRKCDYIWLMSPDQYNLLTKSLKRKKIIYDCMDDMLEFPMTEAKKNMLQEAEYNLCKSSYVIFTSSTYLKGKLQKRYSVENIHVVNNAIKDITDFSIELPAKLQHCFDDNCTDITYIGTISSWLDVELLMLIIEHHPDVVVNLFGPLEIELPENKNLRYCGVLSHDEVFAAMDRSDILIMPFILNELILSVNPVKLYEYIYSGKVCIAPRYGESLQFEEYVYLYNNRDECVKLIGDLKATGCKTKQSLCDSRKFAANNTWKKRVETILKIVE